MTVAEGTYRTAVALESAIDTATASLKPWLGTSGLTGSLDSNDVLSVASDDASGYIDEVIRVVGEAELKSGIGKRRWTGISGPSYDIENPQSMNALVGNMSDARDAARILR